MNKMKPLIFFIFIILLYSNFSSAEEVSCENLQDIIIEGEFKSKPDKDEVNGFGFNFYGNFDEEKNFYFDTEITNNKGIKINKIYNYDLAENFKIDDVIIKINDTNIAELIEKEKNYPKVPTKKIQKLFDENYNLVIESINDESDQIKTTLITKQIYEYPIQVYLDFTLEDITYIDVKNNTYTAKYYISTEWKDNRLKKYLEKIDNNYCKFSRINENSFLYNQLWSPEIIEENKIDNVDTYDNFQYADIYLELIGEDVFIRMYKVNNAVFNYNFDLKEFPFDIQYLVFLLNSPEINTEIQLEEWFDGSFAKNSGYFMQNIVHPEWQYLETNSNINSYRYSDGTYYDEFSLLLSAQRNVEYYITKVIIPIFLILIICWSVFWISGLQLESRLTVTSVSFLALIAYNYVVEEDLPKLGYNTVLDQIILCSYVFAGLATILTVYSYTNCKNNGYEFCTMDYVARYAGPIAYFIVNGVLILNGIQSMTAAEFLGRFL